MERLLGVCALAFSVSVFAQQGEPRDSQQEQEYRQDAQQQHSPQYGQDTGQPERSPQSTQPEQAYGEGPRQSDETQDAQQQMPQSTDAEPASQSQALQELANEHDNLSTFVSALQETGLAETVAQGEYTAFAPTNEAFESAGIDMEELRRPENREQFVQLLRNHLVAEHVDAERAKQLGQALTVEGETLELAESDGELTVNGAKVTETDVRAEGLIVHTIDQVLQPGEDARVARQDGTSEQPDFED